MQTSILNSQLQKSEQTLYLRQLPFQPSQDFQKISQIIKNSFPDSTQIDNIKVFDKKANDYSGEFYAIVIFKNAEEAKKALDLKTIRINSKQVQLEKHLIKRQYQIYIKDIGDLNSSELEQELSHFGKINEIRIEKNFNNLRCCSIRFENVQQSKQCLMNEYLKINGNALKLEKYIDHNQQQKNYNKLVIKKLPLYIDAKLLETQLTNQLLKFGHLQTAIEIKSGKYFRSAIAVYQNNKSVDNALISFNRSFLNLQEPVNLQHFISNKQRNQKDSIFLNNLKSDIPINQIIEAFSIFGKIQSHSIYTYKFNPYQIIQRGSITYQNKQSFADALINSHTIKQIRSLFVNNVPKLNIYQDKTERIQFKKVFVSKKYQNIYYPPLPDMGYVQRFQPMMPGTQMYPGTVMNPSNNSPTFMYQNMGNISKK